MSGSPGSLPGTDLVVRPALVFDGLTCAIPADKSADVNAKFKQGDTAEIRCAFANGQNTLTRIEKRR